MAQGETARLLTPLSVACALGLVAAAWFAPLPDPSLPGPPSGGIQGVDGATGGDDTRAVGGSEDHDWLALADPLLKLREPIEEKPKDEGEIERPQPVRPPVSVRYLGYASAGEGQAAALLDIEGSQRFVSVGQIIAIPDRDDLKITEITPDKVIYEIDGVAMTITRDRSNPNGGPSSAPPPRPEMLTPPASEEALRGQFDGSGRRDRR